MNLYYVHDKDCSYRLAIYATCVWNARHKASEWMRKQYDVYIPVYNWYAELCDNNTIIG